MLRLTAALNASAWMSVALLFATAAHALEPTQVFEKASPSVWVVRTYDDAERPVGLGSAVVIGPGRLVTNCHVLVKSKAVYVRRENVMYQATLEHADAPRDLCQLQVAKFEAPAVQLRPAGELKVGERVFAIGNPKGLEVTLSEGLVSGLRDLSDASIGQGTLVQTSAALSPGSSGGGLFDAEGRLIGITTFGWRDAQNLNIALPTEWIGEIPARAQAALAARSAPQGAATAAATAVPPGYPAPGTVWTYSFIERLFARRKVDVTIRALRVDDGLVEESVVASTGSAGDARRIVDSRSTRFIEHRLSGDTNLLELAPYLLATHGGTRPSGDLAPAGYPQGPAGFAGWSTSAKAGDWEEITVPAGTYRVIRVEAEGSRTRPQVTNYPVPFSFKMRVWYAPDARRIVKLEHQIWSADISGHLSPYADIVLELSSYKPPN